MNKFLLCLPIFGITALAHLVAAGDEAKPTSDTVTDLKQALAEVPHNLAIAVRNPATRETAVTQATDILRDKVQGRMADLTFKIEVIETETRGDKKETGYRMRAEEKHIGEVGTNFITYLWVHFDLGENAKLAAVKKGSQISVTGKITEAFITVKPAPALHIDLAEAKVKAP